LEFDASLEQSSRPALTLWGSSAKLYFKFFKTSNQMGVQIAC